ncbi:MAG: 50S ribosomal protein L18 [Bacteroidia bacterium]|nr:50S ribosomal protein L18 [Bacteroidia bacterium]
MSLSKENKRSRIHKRIRKRIKGTAERPRLVVYRSNKDIYCQLIDDLNGITLASASSKDDSVKGGNKAERAVEVGKMIADKAKRAEIETVVFDRGGYLYHGRVKSLAEGARENGLNF